MMLACVQALEVHDMEKDIAAFIKKYFDGRYEPTWHCIVGQSFGALRTLSDVQYMPSPRKEPSRNVLMFRRIVCYA